MRCEYCGTKRNTDGGCASCLLYNAAVVAIDAAAQEIANERAPGSRGWMNEYGIFASCKDGVQRQIGSPEEAAPFCGLTAAARRVRLPEPVD